MFFYRLCEDADFGRVMQYGPAKVASEMVRRKLLTPNEAYVMVAYWREDLPTFKKIGAELGLTTERIRQIRNNAVYMASIFVQVEGGQ